MGTYNEFHVTPERLEKVEELASQGLYEYQIAYCMGIAPETFSHKKKSHPELADAVNRGQARGVERVTRKLLEKADKGDMTAIIFYLKCKGQWREAKEEDNSEENLKNAVNALKDLATKCLEKK